MKQALSNRKIKKSHQNLKGRWAGVLIAFFLASFALSFYITSYNRGLEGVSATKNDLKKDEIGAIVKTRDIQTQKKYYLQLINRIGPEKAQDMLKNSGLPHDGNTHLLNHTVGEYLYDKYGPGGITKCNDYFSSSCYHGIIINTLSGGKMDDMDNMLETCREKGEGFLDNCVHGMGHGFLPWVGYANLTKALDLCDEVSTRVGGVTVDACYTGVFMENIWGVHEGEPSLDRWVSVDDMQYPCNDSRISERYLGACWQQQHTIMYDVFKLNHVQIAGECIKLADEKFQSNCFMGLFQFIHGFSRNNLNIQFSECGKMPPKWIRRCLISQVNFGVAQGDSMTPFEICAHMNQEDNGACYTDLNKYINRYVSTDSKRSWCKKIPTNNKGPECQGY